MMDYYSEFPGPSKEEAKKTITMRSEKTFYQENIDFIHNNKEVALKKLISESIDESINILYKDSKDCPYSLSGWSVFGVKDCQEKSKNLLLDKVSEWKKNYIFNKYLELLMPKILYKNNITEGGIEQIIRDYL